MDSIWIRSQVGTAFVNNDIDDSSMPRMNIDITFMSFNSQQRMRPNLKLPVRWTGRSMNCVMYSTVGRHNGSTVVPANSAADWRDIIQIYPYA
jgi:hypothetical protein